MRRIWKEKGLEKVRFTLSINSIRLFIFINILGRRRGWEEKWLEDKWLGGEEVERKEGWDEKGLTIDIIL